jgi:hypothetical protein
MERNQFLQNPPHCHVPLSYKEVQILCKIYIVEDIVYTVQGNMRLQRGHVGKKLCPR